MTTRLSVAHPHVSTMMPEGTKWLRPDPAESPERSRRERELARLLLAKARWKRGLARLEGRSPIASR
ncbi:hypothetical protein P12x_006074 (plasmid) [Tundrisphaera lichenicola]|uniref:hypothetical protein n=1 Tax=Tundrisphaera lichenicola TaxID=2029860 RepID=UPI003EB7E45A